MRVGRLKKSLTLKAIVEITFFPGEANEIIALMLKNFRAVSEAERRTFLVVLNRFSSHILTFRFIPPLYDSHLF